MEPKKAKPIETESKMVTRGWVGIGKCWSEDYKMNSFQRSNVQCGILNSLDEVFFSLLNLKSLSHVVDRIMPLAPGCPLLSHWSLCTGYPTWLKGLCICD